MNNNNNLIQSLLKSSKSLSLGWIFFLFSIPQKSVAEEASAFTDLLMNGHSAISDFFVNTADRLDRFIVGKRLTRSENKTKVVLENSAIISDGETTEFVHNINIDLRLPNVEKYWTVKFTSYDEQEKQRKVRRNYLGESPRERKYTAGFSFFNFLDAFQPVRFEYKPQIYLQDPLKISHLFKFSSNIEKKDLTFNPKSEFFANPEKGTGVFQGLNVTKDFNEIYAGTLINEAEYQELENKFTMVQGLALNQTLNEVSSMSYNLIFISDNRPSYHLDSFSTSFGYSRTLIKNILDMQIIPGISFAKNYRFKGRTSAVVNLNLSF